MTGSADLTQLAGILTTLGAFGVVLNKLGTIAWGRLKCLWSVFWRNLGLNWHVVWDPVASWKTTKDVAAEIPETFANSFTGSLRLVLLILAFIPLLAVAAFGHKAGVPDRETHHVVVIDPRDAVAADIRPHLRKGRALSLLYRNAQMRPSRSGEGVCLGDVKQQWLGLLSGIVRGCVACPEGQDCSAKADFGAILEVTGYASIAPAAGTSACTPAQSETFNCKVANLRARAVGEFLAYSSSDEQQEKQKADKWKCPADGQALFPRANACPADDCPSGELADCENGLCKLNVSVDGRNFDILVRQWARGKEMQADKPADDGALPTPRHYDLELRNRAVRIKVLQDCPPLPQPPEAAEAARPLSPAPPPEAAAPT